eukprot:6156460-Amphidinium_carterae.1
MLSSNQQHAARWGIGRLAVMLENGRLLSRHCHGTPVARTSTLIKIAAKAKQYPSIIASMIHCLSYFANRGQVSIVL